MPRCQARWTKRGHDCDDDVHTWRYVQTAPGLWVTVGLCRRHALVWDQMTEWKDLFPLDIQREQVPHDYHRQVISEEAQRELFERAASVEPLEHACPVHEEPPGEPCHFENHRCQRRWRTAILSLSNGQKVD